MPTTLQLEGGREVKRKGGREKERERGGRGGECGGVVIGQEWLVLADVSLTVI